MKIPTSLLVAGFCWSLVSYHVTEALTSETDVISTTDNKTEGIIDEINKANNTEFNESTTSDRVQIGSNCPMGTQDPCSKAINNSHCKESICQCNHGFVQNVNGTECLKKAEKPGDSCETEKQCESFEGYCDGSKCISQESVTTDPLDHERKEKAETNKSSIFLTSASTAAVSLVLLFLPRILQQML